MARPRTTGRMQSVDDLEQAVRVLLTTILTEQSDGFGCGAAPGGFRFRLSDHFCIAGAYVCGKALPRRIERCSVDGCLAFCRHGMIDPDLI